MRIILEVVVFAALVSIAANAQTTSATRTPVDSAITRIELNRTGWVPIVTLNDGSTVDGGGLVEAQVTPENASLTECVCGRDGRRHGMLHVVAEERTRKSTFEWLKAEIQSSGLFPSVPSVLQANAGALYTITIYKGRYAASITAHVLPGVPLSRQDSRAVLLFMRILGIMRQMGWTTVTFSSRFPDNANSRAVPARPSTA